MKASTTLVLFLYAVNGNGMTIPEKIKAARGAASQVERVQVLEDIDVGVLFF